MDEFSVIQDILQYRVGNQLLYNENLIRIRNPEVRELFAMLRDDEMRNIIKLQQRLERKRAPKSIITRIIPTRTKF